MLGMTVKLKALLTAQLGTALRGEANGAVAPGPALLNARRGPLTIPIDVQFSNSTAFWIISY